MRRCPTCRTECPADGSACDACGTAFALEPHAEFDESDYLAANPDVAAAIAAGTLPDAATHWLVHGQFEGRPLTPVPTRDEIVRPMLDPEGRGIEVGPLDKPLMPKREGFRVEIVDLASTEELRATYREQEVDLDAIEPVDHIVGDRRISDVIEGLGTFDWVVASHVIEHLADPLGFLRSAESIIGAAGRVVLVIPDKRHCFDHFGELTTSGQVVDAFLERRDVPTPGQILDHVARSAVADGSIAWGRSSDAEPEPMYGRDHIRGDFERALDGETFDGQIHCWRFTPESFRLLVDDLRTLGLTRLGIVGEHDTIGIEFFVSLGRVDGAATEVDRRELLAGSSASHSRRGP